MEWSSAIVFSSACLFWQIEICWACNLIKTMIRFQGIDLVIMGALLVYSWSVAQSTVVISLSQLLIVHGFAMALSFPWKITRTHLMCSYEKLSFYLSSDNVFFPISFSVCLRFTNPLFFLFLPFSFSRYTLNLDIQISRYT